MCTGSTGGGLFGSIIFASGFSTSFMGFARFPWILRLIVIASLITASLAPQAFKALIIRVPNFCNGSKIISLASTAFIYVVCVEITLASAASALVLKVFMFAILIAFRLGL